VLDGAVRLAIGTVLGLSPILTALALLALAEWRDRRRAAAIAWQVRLTDAISGELGGVVAPVVSRGLGAHWRVEMRLPVSPPALVSRVLAITRDTLREPELTPYDLVLRPEPAPEGVGESTAPRSPALRVVRVVPASKARTRNYHGASTPEPAARFPRRAVTRGAQLLG
jgi:hypothetical protein